MAERIYSARAIYALLLVIAIDCMGYGIVFPVFTPMFLQGHSPLLPSFITLSTQHFIYGLLVALYPFCMLFGAPVLGDFSDRIGRKKVLLICLVGSVIGYFVAALGISAHLFVLLVLGRIINGITAGSLPMAQAAIADVCVDEKAKAKFMGLMMFAIAGGQVIGPFVAGFFSDQNISSLFTDATPFYVASLLALLNIVWLLKAFSETYVVNEGKGFNVFRSLKSFVTVFDSKKLLLMTTVFFCMQLSWSLFSQSTPAYLEYRYTYTHFLLGVFSGSLGVIGAVASFIVIPAVIKKISSGKGAVLGLMMMGLGTLLAALIQNEICFWLGTIINTLGAFIAFTFIITLFSGLVSEDKQGWVMGLTGAVIAVAWTITALLTGVLINSVGTLPLLMACVFAVAGGYIVYRS